MLVNLHSSVNAACDMRSHALACRAPMMWAAPMCQCTSGVWEPRVSQTQLRFCHRYGRLMHWFMHVYIDACMRSPCTRTTWFTPQRIVETDCSRCHPHGCGLYSHSCIDLGAFCSNHAHTCCPTIGGVNKKQTIGACVFAPGPTLRCCGLVRPGRVRESCESWPL